MRFLPAFALLTTCLTNGFSQTTQAPQYLQDFAKVVGKAGTANPDGSYRINIARNDVKFVNSSGMAIPADLGLTTYIAVSGTEDKSLAVGDIAMLEGEIDQVIDALRAGGYELVALHNHMTTEEPRLFYMHFQATGPAAGLAKTFRSALDILGKGVKRLPSANIGKPKIDADALAAVFGSKAQVFPSGVVRFSVPRKDLKVSIYELPFTPAMGVASWAAFGACECGQTMVMGDTCCLQSELQSVIDGYRKAGIHITSIHNHTLGASQQVIFMHYEAEGDAVTVAKGIKAAWSNLGK